jgi:hypothetical protein
MNVDRACQGACLRIPRQAGQGESVDGREETKSDAQLASATVEPERLKVSSPVPVLCSPVDPHASIRSAQVYLRSQS